MSVQPAHEWVGQELSERYRVDSEIGSGGMGVVFRARDKRLGTDVVIKTPHRHMLGDRELLLRFQREIRSLINISHPNIVQVLDVGFHEDIPFAVMQYLSGRSLAERPGPCSVSAVAEWLPDVCDALDFVHEKGLVHRDIKPANILFGESERAYVGDFGLAKVLSQADVRTSLTGTGAPLGTLPYWPPEILNDEGAKGLNSRSDQYSLAVTVYEILAGHVPFQIQSIGEFLVKLHKFEPQSLHQLQQSIPESTSRVVARALSKRPEDRFRSCAEFSNAFLKSAETRAVRRPEARSPDPPRPRSERRLSKREKIKDWLCAAVFPVVFGVFGCFLYQQSVDNPQKNKELIQPTGRDNALTGVSLLDSPPGVGIAGSPVVSTIADELSKDDKEGLLAGRVLFGRTYEIAPSAFKDDAEAFIWLQNAAEQGHAVAQYELGTLYEDGTGVHEDDAKAAKWFQMAAEQGYADAQDWLAIMYLNGTGVPRDDAESVKWLRKAAEGGVARAQYWLGQKFLFGEGVPEDHTAAVKWLKTVAEQGDMIAQNDLGDIYRISTVVKDDVESYAWYYVASAKGHKIAKENLANAEGQLTEEQLAAARKRATELVKQINANEK